MSFIVMFYVSLLDCRKLELRLSNPTCWFDAGLSQRSCSLCHSISSLDRCLFSEIVWITLRHHNWPQPTYEFHSLTNIKRVIFHASMKENGSIIRLTIKRLFWKVGLKIASD